MLAVLRGHAVASIQSPDRPADLQWTRFHRHRLQDDRPAAKNLKADALGITSNRVAVSKVFFAWLALQCPALADVPDKPARLRVQRSTVYEYVRDVCTK